MEELFSLKDLGSQTLPTLSSRDPMNVHHITSKNFTNYGKGSDFHEIFEFLGVGIFNLDSDEWKQERTLLHSLLKNKIFEIFLQQIIQNKLQNCLLPFLDQASKGVKLFLWRTLRGYLPVRGHIVQKGVQWSNN
ncbi:unnamed protein product [Trifolium pratense]|uniref:Uncharacterized protein n=1 Tax=Trifolium pratense TaxID=57577 RepID=A0ACB0M2Y0_TRIPR|nr:unnamed protein product [Trifolium pratense]